MKLINRSFTSDLVFFDIFSFRSVFEWTHTSAGSWYSVSAWHLRFTQIHPADKSPLPNALYHLSNHLYIILFFDNYDIKKWTRKMIISSRCFDSCDKCKKALFKIHIAKNFCSSCWSSLTPQRVILLFHIFISPSSFNKTM